MERDAAPIPAAFGHFLMGLIAGGISLLAFPGRLTPQAPLPGLSLLLSPLGTGIAMHWIGRWSQSFFVYNPALLTFRAGALFAFAMALVRFVWFFWK